MSSPQRDLAIHHAASPPVLAVDDYYATPDVQERIREYCGGARAVRPSAAYVVTLGTDAQAHPTWDGATRVPSSELDTIWTSGADVARALWDAHHLVFVIEIDYENPDAQGEPFLHPADVFVKLEPAYQAALDVFETLRLPVAAIMTGTAKRNENSTIAMRRMPTKRPPRMVAAERDTPGTMATA